MIRAALVMLALLSFNSAVAQAPMIVMATPTNVIHVGTPVQLETRAELTTEGKLLKVGQRVELTMQQPLLLNNQVAIAAGSAAYGEITSVRNKGMWGKSGGITARVLYLEANGRQIRLNGSFTDRGETGTAGVVASVALIPVAGFFVTGTSAKVAPGTRVTAFIAEEVPVQFSGDAPTPTASSAALAAPVAATGTELAPAAQHGLESKQ